MKPEELIKKGLEYFDLPRGPATLSCLAAYILELERWNRRINLTGKKGLHEIVEGLLYDSFFLCSQMGRVGRALDVGSGSGILAIPICILQCAEEIFSVDRSGKKIQFQRHIKRTLGLEGLTPLQADIETVDLAGIDVLAAKAFGATPDTLRKAGRHLKEGGLAFLLKGKNDKTMEADGFVCIKAEHYLLPGDPKEYRLFVYKKV